MEARLTDIPHALLLSFKSIVNIFCILNTITSLHFLLAFFSFTGQSRDSYYKCLISLNPRNKLNELDF